jgi:asparagine N-glycosylation enzyme membrane subunit Stt3
MNKKILVLIISTIFLTISFSGCTQQSPSTEKTATTLHEEDLRLSSMDLVGGKYKTCILKEEVFKDGNWSDTYRYSIVYEKNNEKFIGFYDPHLRPALELIKNNLSEDATILCWWRYGHMIEGYSEKTAIATFPSKNTTDDWKKYLLDARWSRDFSFKWASNETIMDITKMLTTTNISSKETRALIEKYNVDYILTFGDKFCAENYYILESLGPSILESEFMKKIGENKYTWTDKVNETLIFKMWDDGYYLNDTTGKLSLRMPNIYGLKLLFITNPFTTAQCTNIRIYKIL